MSGYVALREEGVKFIKKVCEGNGNSLLQGKNDSGALPYCNPPTPSNKIWICKPTDSAGKILTTNTQLGEMLVYWFNKYSKQYGLNANIVAAQAYAESGYKLWNYPLTSTASGICQFVMETIYDIIVSNRDGSFTEAEINAITKNWTTDNKDITTFKVNHTGKNNRPFLHQNVCNNPQIIIKAQCSYLKFIADKYTDGIASSTLFGYSRGQGVAFPSYTKSIEAARNSKFGAGYEKEGIIYVERIFRLLGVKPNEKGGSPKGYFGYDELNMNGTFSEWDAEIAETELRQK